MKILFLTTHYPPNNTGAAVVMKNLIKGIDKSLVGGVVTHANTFNDDKETIDSTEIFYIFHLAQLFNIRIRYFIRYILFYFELRKINKIVVEKRITHLVTVYPDLDFLELGLKCSKRFPEIKFIPYLHDTVYEGLKNRFFSKRAFKVQNEILKGKNILVMSEGMKDLFKRKYNVKTIPILHSFNEEIKYKNYDLSDSKNSVFWGGSIYSINKNTALRIHKSIKKYNTNLKLSSANKVSNLIKMGFDEKFFEILPFLSRDKYLKLLSEQKALLLGIDFPDESSIDEDELSTIFPTKTIEYLISGKPIIAHCPENYFLSKFLKENDCALVVNTRDINKMSQVINDYFNNKSLMKKHIKNAYETAKIFKAKNVRNKFMDEILQ